MIRSLALAHRLALRNVRRYARRSIITAVTIWFGMVMVVFTIGISEGAYRRVVDTAARSGPGHVAVQTPDLDPFEPEPLARADEAMAIAAAIPGAEIAPRARLPALLSSAGGSVNLLALGVEPALERKTSILSEALVEGEWLPDEQGRVPEIVIGRTTARRLDLGLGDRAVVMAQVDGELSSVLLRVGGIFALGSDEVDSGIAVVPIHTLQLLLGQPDAVHQVAVILDDLHRARPVQRQLQAALPDAEVQTWDQLLPELGDYVTMDRNGGDVSFAFLFAIVAVAVLNAVLMSVLERVKEFGLMLAVGTRPSTLFLVVVLEALVLSMGSAALGAVVGGALVLWMGHTGVDLATLFGMEQSMDVAGYDISGTIYPYLPPLRTLYMSAMVVVVTVAGSLWPAWKATRIEPVEAIRHD